MSRHGPTSASIRHNVDLDIEYFSRSELGQGEPQVLDAGEEAAATLLQYDSDYGAGEGTRDTYVFVVRSTRAETRLLQYLLAGPLFASFHSIQARARHQVFRLPGPRQLYLKSLKSIILGVP